MPKNIVFCADGTWNGPHEPDSDDKTASATNVFKLFLSLAGKDTPETTRLEKEQERTFDQDGTQIQVAKYLHGVGDSDNFLVKMMGGAIGAGLTTRIIRGYTFISRNYEPDDKIFIVGFSRGAYTARALAGMIAAKGLLDAGKADLTREDAYRRGAKVWYEYRQAALSSNPSALGKCEEFVLDLPGFFTKAPDTPLIAAPIEAVAVWDTVGAYGIPEYTKDLVPIDVLQFADRKLTPNVKHGLHALAVDEQRKAFTPTLWDPDGRVTQVLFPGGHSDVGGGYPEGQSGLSDGPLRWMTSELAELNVEFRGKPDTITPPPNPGGMMHELWLQFPWTGIPGGAGPRAFPPGLKLSQSVLDRMKAISYAPQNLAAYIDFARKAALSHVDVV